ncbi:S-layer homology domain-containing protein [Pusillibacter faecalis]|uniref:anthrax toxin lethal factor-related metalloendopeptidase n=1 Tax=Pusillibacter faecalis TaxID=2714358 RepID=UPI002941F9E1|nr:S-layer homology domain-containing protein [Pusillibacter faecalis]
MNAKRLFNLCAAVFLTLSFIILPASAAETFSDIPADSLYYESVDYLAERGITSGTGGGCFSPGRPITVREWAVFLSRAFGGRPLSGELSDDPTALCIQRCYQNGWLGVSSAASPDETLCRGELLLSAFRAAGLPVYEASLYGGARMTPQENALRLGGELGLCPKESSASELMTRGAAARLLFSLLTQSYAVAGPPVLNALSIQAAPSADLNRYLMEIECVPAPILRTFREAGWEYHVSPAYLQTYSRQHGLSCIGLTSYSERRIYVSVPSSTLHEFGHFLDWTLGFPAEHEALYHEEAHSARTVLREYALANSREYFADCFAFWIRNSDDESQLERLSAAPPKTYAYFSELAAHGWSAE